MCNENSSPTIISFDLLVPGVSLTCQKLTCLTKRSLPKSSRMNGLFCSVSKRMGNSDVQQKYSSWTSACDWPIAAIVREEQLRGVLQRRGSFFDRSV